MDGRTFIAKVVLMSEDGHQNKSTVVAPGRSNSRQMENIDKAFPYQSLIGETAVPGTTFYDPDTGNPSVFFIFQKLSVRIHGEFRLLCHVVDCTRYVVDSCSITMETVSVLTDKFTVYLPKLFPGVTAPTDLLKSLSVQGLKVMHRKYKR
jgi:hypothetical protein